MRFITTNVHGFLDYLLGLYLIALPWLFGYAVIGGPSTWVPVVLGVAVVTYSLLTDYEWGLVKRLPIEGHLILDLLVGATLLLSIPFFGFFDTTYWIPYSSVAVVIIVLSLLTRRQTQASRPFFPYKAKVLSA